MGWFGVGKYQKSKQLSLITLFLPQPLKESKYIRLSIIFLPVQCSPTSFPMRLLSYQKSSQITQKQEKIRFKNIEKMKKIFPPFGPSPNNSPHHDGSKFFYSLCESSDFVRPRYLRTNIP